MQWATNLQFYYLIPDPKVGEQHIQGKLYSKCNSFQVTTELLHIDNMKVAIAQGRDSQKVLSLRHFFGLRTVLKL